MKSFEKLADFLEGVRSPGPLKNISMRVPGYLELSLRSVAEIQGVPYTRLAGMLLETALEQYAPIAQERFERAGNQIVDIRPSALHAEIGDVLITMPEKFGTLTKEEQQAELERFHSEQEDSPEVTS